MLSAQKLSDVIRNTVFRYHPGFNGLFLHFRPPKISKSPSPVPFFPKTSMVADFYHGQLSPAFERISESDVSFVMYYAPWDAESQVVRVQFKIVAQYYYKQVTNFCDLS